MQFETTMSQTGNNTGIEVPAEVVEALGGGRRAPVVVTVNGYEYRSTLAVMGGRHMIPFSSDKRAATGISGGDPIAVEIELDAAPRTVDVPEDFAAALDATPGAREAFDRLAPSHQKAHVTAITEAKAPETRARRIAKAIEKLVGA
ncbi:YdeI/OmpD-associated family protein [Agromyces sp. M3QZ16-3]|uniref:YdeI/OmpD-associated family protein n=1 Tax=Agromyces sp. M3QZ16-3 TaxID=3447585 RepID=UPI003F68DF15